MYITVKIEKKEIIMNQLERAVLGSDKTDLTQGLRQLMLTMY